MIVHTLHLEHRHDRYDNMMKQAAEQGFEIMWHEGIHNKKNPKQEITKGHQRIVQFAKDNNMPEIIISEDDLNFLHPNSFNYFIENKPKSFDLYLAFVYVGDVEGNRVVSSFSGGMSLYVINERFYDFFLNFESNQHIDRGIGKYGREFEFIVPPKICLEQTGGFSDNMKRSITSYRVYFEGRELYNGN